MHLEVNSGVNVELAAVDEAQHHLLHGVGKCPVPVADGFDQRRVNALFGGRARRFDKI